MTDAIPPSGRNVASRALLVLTRSGRPGAKLTILASGAPWIEVSRLWPSGVEANFASKRPAVMTVRWARALAGLGFCAGEIVIGAAMSKSWGDEAGGEALAADRSVLAACCARRTPSEA